MITLKKLENNDVFVFDIEGKIDQACVDTFYALLAEKAAKHEKLRVLGIVREFPSFESFKAFSATAKLKAKALAGIGRYAVVSDKGWVETLLPMGNFLTPNIPVKYFPPQELPEAIAWLEADEEEPAPTVSNTRLERLPGANAYSFVIDGEIRESDVTSFYNTLRNAASLGKARLLVTFRDFDGFESFQTLLHGIRADFASLGNVEKYAVLADQQWLTALATATDFLTPGLELKTFGLAERPQALAWLRA